MEVVDRLLQIAHTDHTSCNCKSILMSIKQTSVWTCHSCGHVHTEVETRAELPGVDADEVANVMLQLNMSNGDTTLQQLYQTHIAGGDVDIRCQHCSHEQAVSNVLVTTSDVFLIRLKRSTSVDDI
eukprot:COSAG05_NODE_12271_length_474_cov_5.291449_1_plen_125_part_10